MAKFARPDFDTKIITPVFRLSYPSVFATSYNQLAKRDEYKITMLFDKKTAVKELAAMYALMARVAEWKFGKGAKGLRNPFVDGDTAVDMQGNLRKESNPSIAGMIYLNSWSKNAPGIVDGKNQPIINSDEVYGGCFCVAQLNAYAYEQGGQRGINFGLLHLQKRKDGDPFGQRTRPEDAFAPVQEESLAEETPTNNSMFS